MLPLMDGMIEYLSAIKDAPLVCVHEHPTKEGRMW